MDALRIRLASALEWLVAAAFLIATLAVVSLILHDMRGTSIRAAGASPASATVVVAPIPATVPLGAVSVPVLTFADERSIRVGDTAAIVATRVGRGADTGREEVDAGRLGQRLTRFYEYSGFRFVVVYEPFERGGTPRISAIYLP
jgi:hypothetical protein